MILIHSTVKLFPSCLRLLILFCLSTTIVLILNLSHFSSKYCWGWILFSRVGVFIQYRKLPRKKNVLKPDCWPTVEKGTNRQQSAVSSDSVAFSYTYNRCVSPLCILLVATVPFSMAGKWFYTYVGFWTLCSIAVPPFLYISITFVRSTLHKLCIFTNTGHAEENKRQFLNKMEILNL